MADSRLREVERRWAATRAVEEEVAYLRERLRTGATGRIEREPFIPASVAPL